MCVIIIIMIVHNIVDYITRLQYDIMNYECKLKISN